MSFLKHRDSSEASRSKRNSRGTGIDELVIFFEFDMLNVAELSYGRQKSGSHQSISEHLESADI